MNSENVVVSVGFNAMPTGCDEEDNSHSLAKYWGSSYNAMPTRCKAGEADRGSSVTDKPNWLDTKYPYGKSGLAWRWGDCVALNNL